MKLNNIVYKIIEQLGDPKEFFWCIELAKEQGKNIINIIFSCNNIDILLVELKIIPYYEVLLDMKIRLTNVIEAKDLVDFLQEIQGRKWVIEIDSKGTNIYVNSDFEESLKYILMILKKTCNNEVTYTCVVREEQ